jgi:hypothetical protein
LARNADFTFKKQTTQKHTTRKHNTRKHTTRKQTPKKHTKQKRKTRTFFDNEVSGVGDAEFEPSQKVWNCATSAQPRVMSLTSEFKAAGDDQNLERRVTRSMTKGPACRAALQHPKILGQIVSHLPGYTILTRAQRVSKLRCDQHFADCAEKALDETAKCPHTVATEQDTHIHRPMPNLAIVALSSGVPIYSGSFHINTLFPRLYSRQARRDTTV